MATSRNVLTIFLLSLILLVISFSAGFFYKYQPQQEQIKVIVEKPVTTENQNTFYSGTIAKIENNIVSLKTEQIVNENQKGTNSTNIALQIVEFSLQGISIQHLEPLNDLLQLQEGMQVVVGGERYYAEKVINGVVFFKEKEE